VYTDGNVADSLTYVLAPTSIDDFLADHYERAPLHIARNDPSYYDDVYGIADVEDSLIVGAREPEQFALVRTEGPPLGPADFTAERPAVRWRSTGKPAKAVLDARKVIGFVDQGYTLVIKDAALFSARLQRFSNGLQHRLRSYAQINVYLTRAGAQGFAVHHDTHDTLTMQIAGEKTWRIYEPLVELPLESQPFLSGEQRPNLRVQREVRLRPGDTLYLPRGVPHEAVDTAGTSLHATFALLPIRVIDLLEMVVRLAAESDLELRRSAPAGWTEAGDFPARFAGLVRARLDAALTPERIGLAREVLLNEQFAITRADAAGSIGQIEALRCLGPESVLGLADDVAFMVRDREQTVDLLIAGRSLGFPKFCRTAFEQLVAGPVTFAGLGPDLSEKNRAVLVRTLILEGLITVDGRALSFSGGAPKL